MKLTTQQLTAILDLVIPYRRPVCFVGVAGTGKTTIMKDKLRHCDPDIFMFLGINFNSFTTSYIAQMAIESVLEKKTGKTFGPPGSRKMIYFIDDLNMPKKEEYGAQPPIEILRFWLGHGGWYDRKSMEKSIKNDVKGATRKMNSASKLIMTDAKVLEKAVEQSKKNQKKQLEGMDDANEGLKDGIRTSKKGTDKLVQDLTTLQDEFAAALDKGLQQKVATMNMMATQNKMTNKKGETPAEC